MNGEISQPQIVRRAFCTVGAGSRDGESPASPCPFCLMLEQADAYTS